MLLSLSANQINNMSYEENIECATDRLLGNREVLKQLLQELVEHDAVHFDDVGNPYWETCGIPLVEGTSLFTEDIISVQPMRGPTDE